MIRQIRFLSYTRTHNYEQNLSDDVTQSYVIRMYVRKTNIGLIWVNESVHMEIGIEEDETLQQTALRRKLGFFGHVVRSDG